MYKVEDEKNSELTEKQRQVVEKGKKEVLDALSQNSKKVKQEHRHDYSKDKNGWVIYRNKSKKKVKLRAFIAKRAKDLRFLDAYPSQLKAREVLIEKYNEGGVNYVDNFVNSEFLKEVQITFDEMKELEKDA